MPFKRSFFFLILFVVFVFSACGRDRGARMHHMLIDEEPYESSGEQLSNEFEIWSQELFDLLVPAMPGYVPSQIIERVSYITSYNNKMLNPNWVAWRLTKEHTEGSYPKTGVPYYADDGSVFGIGKITQEIYSNKYFVDLEAEEPRQEHDDWRERPSNLDHGHMCPAGDNKWDKAAMNQSYLLTNMCPQDNRLNSGGWNRLEEKCRKWAVEYGEIYIVAGPIFYNGVQKTFGANKIAVPDAFFKVVLCMRGTPKAIGFVYKNDSSSQPMKSQVRCVDEIEELTGFDFFSVLPDEIENVIEAESNLAFW